MARTLQERLRGYLGEVIQDGQTDADTFFSDETIDNLLLEAGDNLFYAVYLGWEEKAAFYSGATDVDESGSSRKLTQLYRQARLQADIWRKRSEDATTAGTGRVSGARSAAWAVSAELASGDPRVKWTPMGNRA